MSSQPDVRFLGSAAIVLLSDGDNTAQLDPLALASVASQAGVRIFPIGIGSPNGAVVEVDGFQVATALDAELLRGVAERSGGTYFAASDADDAAARLRPHRPEAHGRRRNTEITAIFAGAGLAAVPGGGRASRCAGTGG